MSFPFTGRILRAVPLSFGIASVLLPDFDFRSA